jgi:hypothetical protein
MTVHLNSEQITALMLHNAGDPDDAAVVARYLTHDARMHAETCQVCRDAAHRLKNAFAPPAWVGSEVSSPSRGLKERILARLGF